MICSRCTHDPPCADRTDMEERHGHPAAFRVTLLARADLTAEEAELGARAYAKDYADAPHRLSEGERAAALAATLLRHGQHRGGERLDLVADGALRNYAYWRDRQRRVQGGRPAPGDDVAYPDDAYVEEDHRRTYVELGARRFHLVRDEDPTGVSGAGVVAVGVVYANGALAGRAALHWLTATRSTAFYTSAEDVEAIHGHAGRSRLAFLDEVPAPPAGPVVQLQPPAPSGDTVRLLETLLADARRGHVRSVAFATVSSGRHIGTGFHLEERCGWEPHTLIGALERLKARILVEPTGGL